MADDLLDALEAALAEAREDAARAVDRADALRELRSLAIAAAHQGRVLHSPADLHDHDDEDARARVAALVARAATDA